MIDFLRDNWRIVLERTCEHLALVVIAMAIALVIGVPLGVLAARRPALQKPIVGAANIFQTIPSLALFGFLLPFLNIGATNAIVALVIYSLLPLVRNTLTGIQSVDENVRQAAVAMGMTERQILRQVELPLAAPFILAGVRTATVLCIGIATIASFIAAGGLGVLIYDGLRNLDNATTLAGAIPAALLALGADGAIGALQHRLENRSRGAAPQNQSARVLTKLSAVPLALFLLLALIGAAVGARSLFGNRVEVAAENAAQQTLRIGSKEFTESRLLAEILAGAIQQEGGSAQVEEGLGGNLPHQALVSGNLDAYPEYTGTAWTEILKQKTKTDARAVYDGVKREYSQQFNLAVSAPLGYSNGFAILVRGADAKRLKLQTISDMRPYAPRWILGCGPDFISRPDGYRGFVRAYGLKFATAPRSMDLALINRALSSKSVDVIVGNETDGLIPKLDLFQLRDDKSYFPPYQTVFVARAAAIRNPAMQRALAKLAGSITPDAIRKMNYEIDAQKKSPHNVAKEWLKESYSSKVAKQ